VPCTFISLSCLPSSVDEHHRDSACVEKTAFCASPQVVWTFTVTHYTRCFTTGGWFVAHTRSVYRRQHRKVYPLFAALPLRCVVTHGFHTHRALHTLRWPRCVRLHTHTRFRLHLRKRLPSHFALNTVPPRFGCPFTLYTRLFVVVPRSHYGWPLHARCVSRWVASVSRTSFVTLPL